MYTQCTCSMRIVQHRRNAPPPRKYDTMNQCWLKADPPSATQVQHLTNIGLMYCVYWAAYSHDSCTRFKSLRYISRSSPSHRKQALVWRIIDGKILKCQMGFSFSYCDMTLCHKAKCNVISIVAVLLCLFQHFAIPYSTMSYHNMKNKIPFGISDFWHQLYAIAWGSNVTNPSENDSYYTSGIIVL